MPTRRELLKHSAKLVWVAPTMTRLFAGHCCDRVATGMYNAKFVDITSPDQTYASLCDADCREWFRQAGQTFEDIRTEVGGVAAIPTKLGF